MSEAQYDFGADDPAPGGPRNVAPHWPIVREPTTETQLEHFSRLELVAMAWKRGFRGLRDVSRRGLMRLLLRR